MSVVSIKDEIFPRGGQRGFVVSASENGCALMDFNGQRVDMAEWYDWSEIEIDPSDRARIIAESNEI
jgi:hypothetical protein